SRTAELAWLGPPSFSTDHPGADSIRFRIRRRGALSPARAGFTVHALSRMIAPPRAAPAGDRTCQASLDLYQEMKLDRAVWRNVAPRPVDRRFSLHPNL